jgi:hypothetical protein
MTTFFFFSAACAPGRRKVSEPALPAAATATTVDRKKSLRDVVLDL